ncbi:MULTISPECIES: response regulator [Gordonia]|uniref:Putative two-component response regulator n=1 Tax=Gordonia sputi NBRC 100414 TaxID=1089453 RepID=H5U6B5_9ACTN|nr:MULTISPECIES: response regulator [Gordonia]NKY92198.1 response regulator transcription factor [Gordonia sputi]OBA73818.1 helix-turn-helix transcriptional regulator [Gordonia sp. 852002-10350_SCH5691597]GAB41273.1 putative two-component response regulator [Gordonia sputi NBRC 100414]
MTPSPVRARIGVVDDHEQIVRGLRATFAEHDGVELVAGADTVAGLLAVTTELDLVLLDLRLDDGTTPLTNIAALTDAGIPVLVYTSGDELYLVRQAASAGVLGVIRKNAREAELLDGIAQALDGNTVANIDWAAAIDSDEEFVDLPPQLRRVLELYAAGESNARVSAELHLSAETVADYVSRIRLRYQAVGRPSPTKTDLYKRAIEDGWLPIPRRLRR